VRGYRLGYPTDSLIPYVSHESSCLLTLTTLSNHLHRLSHVVLVSCLLQGRFFIQDCTVLLPRELAKQSAPGCHCERYCARKFPYFNH
jgi:hypothetical protein